MNIFQQNQEEKTRTYQGRGKDAQEYSIKKGEGEGKEKGIYHGRNICPESDEGDG